LRGYIAAMVVSAIAASLLLPSCSGQGNGIGYVTSGADSSEALQLISQAPSTDAIVFPSPLNTSLGVDEYPSVARALMLSGGSTYSALGDINGDGRTDLVVAVSDSKMVSVFYRQSDGSYPSYASANISLDRTPIGVSTIDSFSNGVNQIMVLEKRVDDFDTERMLVFNFTSQTSPFIEFKNLTVFETANSFAIGKLNSDSYPDVAFSCPGLNPSSDNGDIEVRFGPAYSTYVQFKAGRGSSSLSIGNFSGDSLSDIAVANYYDRNINVFFQPFSPGNSPNYTLTMSGYPMSLTTGDLNFDSLDDVAVVTASPHSLLFFFQSLGSLQTLPDPTYSRDLVWESPTSVFSGDMNGDGRADLAMLSGDTNFAFGLLQRSTIPVWPSSYDFMFPVGATPRHLLIGNLDSDTRTDIAVSTARDDWTGSSIAVYPSRAPLSPLFSNSNRTYLGNMSQVAGQVLLGDLNGDGTNEILLLYSSNASVEVVSTVTGQGFNKTLGFTPSKMAIADCNGDGFDDVLFSRIAGANLSLALGVADLSGPFVFQQLVCGGNVTAFAHGDINNDSMEDVVAATDDGRIDIFFNTGDSQDPYGSPYEIVPDPGEAIPAIAVGDFNSDGLDDLAYSLPSLEINVSFQKPASPFISAQADTQLYDVMAGGGVFSQLWAAELNGDNKADIAAMRPSDSLVCLFDQEDFLTSRSPYLRFAFPEAPSYVNLVDATDDGHADLLAAFPSADLLFLYKQTAGALPSKPSMVFVTGASPNCAVVGDTGSSLRESLLVSDSQSHSVSVWEAANVPPTADAGGPYTGTQGYPIQFLGYATDSISDMLNLQYRWDFGDGNSSAWSSSPAASHVFEYEGSYVAIFYVRDPGGRYASDNASVEVADSVPIVDFWWSPASPVEGVQVVFTENVSSADPLIMINWTIDGSLVSSDLEHSIAWTFQDGTHEVNLEVTDSDGSTSNLTKSVVVGRSAPQVSLSGPLSATEDDVITFYASVDAWHSGVGDSIVRYEWNFSYAGVFISDRTTASNTTTWVFDSPSDTNIFEVVARATDNDGDQGYGFFNITIFDRTKVTLTIDSSSPYYEFDTLNFTATIDSSHPATLFEWQFKANASDTFTPDESTLVGFTTHAYNEAGIFLVKVRATVSNGSSAMASIYISVDDVVPSGTFEEYVTWSRNPDLTSEITFNATALAERYPDIIRTSWEFGDGDVTQLFGGPVSPVVHKYDPTRDYSFVLNVTDDDGTTLFLNATLKLSEPSILLASPSGDSVIRAGTPIRLLISDDSPPLLWVKYSINNGSMMDFAAQWEISTVGWSDGDYALVVKAADKDGNIAVKDGILIAVDGQAPIVTILWASPSVFGGSVINITVNITEPHIDSSEIILYVKLPGSDSFSQIRMEHSTGQTYYALVEIPKRAGTMVFHVNATDLAENSADTETVSVPVKLHFIDAAWPYMLALAVLAAIGTAGYFIRESKIAVDETFVIYNDGRLIAHSTRHLKPGMDDQVLGGMLTAIQDFVKESFKDVTSFTLRKLEFGEKSVLIEKGQHLFLAVILHGKASKKVASKMERIVDEIEERFSSALPGWDGDLDALRGVSDIAKKLYSKAPLLPPFRKQGS
jgi:hypothetical protein